MQKPKTRAERILYSETIHKNRYCQFVIEVRSYPADMGAHEYGLSIVEQRHDRRGRYHERTFTISNHLVEGFGAVVNDAVQTWQEACCAIRSD